MSGVAVAGGVTLLLGLVAPGVAVAAPELPPGCERGPERSVTCTYDEPGAAVPFTVPAGVTELGVTARGAAGAVGGNARGAGAAGGAGAVVDETATVTPGAALEVRVGAVGTAGNPNPGSSGNAVPAVPGGAGFGAGGQGGGSTVGGGTAGGGGGGGGGGGSALRDPAGGDDGGLVVAGGGGGGGGGAQGPQGPAGAGGNAGAAGGSTGGGQTPGGQPGAAPGPNGGDGMMSALRSSGQGGGGGGARGGTAGGPPTNAPREINPGAGGGGGTSIGTVTGTNAGNGSVVITYTEPLAAGAIEPTSGGGQSAQTGQPFPEPLVATVTDSVDPEAAVPGAPVTFTVTAGTASFPDGATAETTTDEAGRATSPTLTAGSSPGPVEVTATTPGVATPATYTLTVTAPPAPRLTIRGAGTLTAGGQRLSLSIDARVAADGTPSGRVAVSGPRPNTFTSNQVTDITRNGSTVTLRGTGLGSDGRSAPYVITVRDNGPRNDGVSIRRGTSNVNGTLSNGDIRFSQ